MAIINRQRHHQPDDDIEVIRLSPTEWDQALQNALNALDLTWNELVNQAKTGDFSSLRARKLWLMAGHRSRGG
jgi:hypothetical protein